MSIQPEVPYSYAAEDSSDDNDENWRDPTMMASHGVPAVRGSQARGSPNMPDYNDTTATPDTGHRNPDNYWVLPAHCNPRDILGSRYKLRSNDIQKLTGSFIEFNEKLNQVDIWGDAEAIGKTKSYLDRIVATIFEKDTTLLRKTKKWDKPDRELTERERRRAEKKQARMDEEKRYQGLPQIAQNYNASLSLLDHSLPILKLLGENDAYLNQIRADCKAFLWYEPQENMIRIAAETEEAVKMAGMRTRNWYMKCCRRPQGGTLRLMQQPKHNCLLQFRKLPAGSVTYEYCDPEREAIMLEKQRFLARIDTGVPMSLNLIDFGDDKGDNDTPSEQVLSEQALTLNRRNEEAISQYLSRGLESLRLNDWNIRLKIRFGQICLIDYPKKDNKFLSIEELSDKIFKKAAFKSALAPCLGKTKADLNHLFEHLTNEKEVYEFSDNPKTSFNIKAKQYPTAAPVKVPGQRDATRGDMWDTTMEISFTDDGHRRLWNTMTDCTDLVDINCVDIDSHYSWDLKLQHARQLPHDDVNAPHEKFSQALSISSSNRLVLVTSSEYMPHLVTQKTKWRYSWKDYVVEICKDEIWDMNRVERTDKELPLDLSSIEPHRTLFKVSLYMEAWQNRLAENLDLKIGEAPSWTLRDFFASPQEDTPTLMKTIREFSDKLHSYVPLYWNSNHSLV